MKACVLYKSILVTLCEAVGTTAFSHSGVTLETLKWFMANVLAHPCFNTIICCQIYFLVHNGKQIFYLNKCFKHTSEENYWLETTILVFKQISQKKTKKTREHVVVLSGKLKSKTWQHKSTWHIYISHKTKKINYKKQVHTKVWQC